MSYKFKTKHESKGKTAIHGFQFENGVCVVDDETGKAAKHVLTQFYNCDVEVVDESQPEEKTVKSDASLKVSATKTESK